MLNTTNISYKILWSELPTHINKMIINNSFLEHFEVRFILKDGINLRRIKSYEPISTLNTSDQNEELNPYTIIYTLLLAPYLVVPSYMG